MLKFSGSSCLIGGPNESWGSSSAWLASCRNYDRCRTARGTWRVESRAAEADTPSTTLCTTSGKWQRSRVHEVRCTRSSRSGTRRVRHHPLASLFGRRDRRGGGEMCQQTLRQACSQAYPGSARCVQSFDDSLDSASRKTYRISLRSSSLWEPRHPSLKVLQR